MLQNAWCNKLLQTENSRSFSLYSAEALMGDANGASNRPPCASRLRDPAPMFEFREERGGFLG